MGARHLALLLLALAALAAGCAEDDGGLAAAPDDPSAEAAEAAEPAEPSERDAEQDPGQEAGQDADDETVSEHDDGLLVVSTVAPMADVLSRVLGDRGEVQALVPPGMDSHTYEPRPGDVAPLSRADAFVDSGLGLNPDAVALAEANLPDGAPLVLLGDEALDPDTLSTQQIHDHGHSHDDGADHSHSHDDETDHSHSHDDGADHSHDDETDHSHSHDDETDHSHDDDHGPVNPHVWASVPLVIELAEHAGEVLAELDPADAEGYAERTAAYTAELEALDAAIGEAVDSLDEQRRTLVVYHDAWAYFGQAYDVEVVAAVQPS
ncbi:MAG: zinc ABC transporter substrate-binding protein, partial [Egibacteraceae bacterium]